MEKITRTIVTHTIKASIVEFDKLKNEIVNTDVPVFTIIGGKMDEEIAIKHIQKHITTKLTPVIIKSIVTTEAVYSLQLDVFLEFAIKETKSNVDEIHHQDVFAPDVKI